MSAGAVTVNSINQPGQIIAEHVLRCRIGRGAYGEVWLATDVTGNHRAVKIVRREDFVEARPFYREFEGMQRFGPVSHMHPGLMKILHVGKNDAAGWFYYVMEAADDLQTGQQIDPSRYVAKTLTRLMQRCTRLPFDECLAIGLSLASAVGHLHQHGLIHRDIKPANIIFVNGVPKLADVGLVTAVSDGATVVGSTGYIPPEGPGRPAGDIYSLGILLYELFTGKRCFDFPEIPTFFQQEEDTFRLLRVFKIILKACEVDIRKRCQSAEELHNALAALLPETRQERT